MVIFKYAADLAGWLKKQRAAGQKINFVPTMGALHAGHISLITISKNRPSLTVCSIFVNPTQFNDPKDFQKYPITIDKDILLLEHAGADVLFLPGIGELYPAGLEDLEHYDLGPLESLLEGKYRPGHFQGVCQVMQRLLNIVRPDDLFMGSKDYQQCMVVQRLLTLMDLPTNLHRCPIVREPDGLAMSSRNVRLTPEQRIRSTAIYQALQTIKAGWPGPADPLIAKARNILEAAGFRIDYIAIADADTLEAASPEASSPEAAMPEAVSPEAVSPEAAPPPAATPRAARPGPKHAIALIAAFIGEVRLIDNLLL